MHCYKVPIIPIDIEGYRGYHNQLIIKELGILIDNTYFCVTFKPSLKNKWENLNDNIKKTNKYIQHNIHGIPYNYGEYEYHEIYNILQSVTNKHCIIYSKGNEKCKLLSYICNKYVYDLNDVISNVKNKVVDICNINYSAQCLHPHKLKNNHCALTKVYLYKNIINNIY